MSPADLPFALLAITPPEGEVDAGVVETWIQAGAKRVGIAVLLRTPGASMGSMVASGRFAALVRACESAKIPTLIGCEGDDLLKFGAIPIGVAGVQLRSDPSNETIAEVRRALPSPLLLGRSTHAAPAEASLDYSVFAPVFAPHTLQAGQTKKPKGLEALKACIRAAHEPVFALGGIDAKTAPACIEAGARGLAGISAFFGRKESVAQTVEAFGDLLDAATDVRAT